MSDSNQPKDPHPSPGTIAVVDRDSLPQHIPHREDAAIDAEDRRNGDRRNSLGYLFSRAAALARDIAAAGGSGPLDPPFFTELRAAIAERVARDAPVSDRAEAVSRVGGVEAVCDQAREAVRAAERRVRLATSELQLLAYPPSGTMGLEPWIPWGLGAIVGVVETAITAPFLRVNLEIGEPESIATAFVLFLAISLVMHTAGQTLGGRIAHDELLSRAVVMLTVLLMLGSIVLAIVELGESREHGSARAKAGDVGASTSSTGSLAEQLDPGESNAAPQTAALAAEPEPADLRFMVPLNIFLVLATGLVGMRQELAREYLEAEEEEQLASEELEDASADLSELEEELAECNGDIGVIEADLGQVAEQEVANYTQISHFWMGEYQRHCARLGKEPRQIVEPEPPTALGMLLALMGHDPDGRPDPPDGGPVVNTDTPESRGRNQDEDEDEGAFGDPIATVTPNGDSPTGDGATPQPRSRHHSRPAAWGWQEDE